MTEVVDHIRTRYRVVEGRTIIDPRLGDEKSLLEQIASAEINPNTADLAKQTLMEYCQVDLATVCENLARDMTGEELMELTNKAIDGVNESHFKWSIPGQEGLKHKPQPLIVAPNHHQAFIEAVRKQLQEGRENLQRNPNDNEVKQVLAAIILTAMGMAPYHRHEVSAMIQHEMSLDKKARVS